MRHDRAGRTSGPGLSATGLASRRLVERTVYLGVLLIFGAGVVGTGHVT
jgi:hypothetical protein